MGLKKAFITAQYDDPNGDLGNRWKDGKTEPHYWEGTVRKDPVDQPVMTDVGYHIRTGEHDVKDFDWEQYLKFADQHLK